MKRFAWLFVAACFAMLAVVACGEEKLVVEPDGGEDLEKDREADPLYRLFSAVWEKIDQEETDQALALLEKAMAEPEFEPNLRTILTERVNLLLHAGRLEEAKTLVFDRIAKDPRATISGMGLLLGYLFDRGLHRDSVKVTGRLMEISGEVVPMVLGWRLRALLFVVAQDITGDPEVKGSGRFIDQNTFCQVLLEMVPDRQAPAALGLARETLAGDPGAEYWGVLLEELGLRISLAQNQLEDFAWGIRKNRNMFSEETLHRMLQAASVAATEAGQPMDPVYQAYMDGLSERPRVALAAARHWVAEAAADRRPTMPERLRNLLDRGFDLNFVRGLFQREYYKNFGCPETTTQMIELAQDMLPQVQENNVRQGIKMMLLDGLFTIERYEDAIVLIEDKIEGMDALWKALNLSKLNSHIAIRDNQPLEAVNHLRDFMRGLQQMPDEDPTFDPTTGLSHTRSMIMGRNQRRIGDLLVQAGKEGDAREAYDQARAYFALALEELEAGSPSAAVARREMEEIP